MRAYKLKRVLVCTDFSTGSDLILKAAQELCDKDGGNIDLLFVSELGLHLDEISKGSEGSTYADRFLGEIKTSIELKMKDQLIRCGVNANTIIREGNITEVILEIAHECKHDFIMMGHGRKPLVHQIFGSNVLKVLSSTPIPLLIIKNPVRLKKVAGLLDESRSLDLVIIGTFDFARSFKCQEIEFISLWLDLPEPFGKPEEGRRLVEKIEEEVSTFSHKDEKPMIKIVPTRDFKLSRVLVDLLEQEEVDVAVLKRFSHGNLKRIYMGSTTKYILENFHGNLLILPP